MRKKSKKKQIVAMTLALSVLSSSVGMCGASAAEALSDTDGSDLQVTIVPLADSNADTATDTTPADDAKTDGDTQTEGDTKADGDTKKEEQPAASTGDGEGSTDQPTDGDGDGDGDNDTSSDDKPTIERPEQSDTVETLPGSAEDNFGKKDDNTGNTEDKGGSGEETPATGDTDTGSTEDKGEESSGSEETPEEKPEETPEEDDLDYSCAYDPENHRFNITFNIKEDAEGDQTIELSKVQEVVQKYGEQKIEEWFKTEEGAAWLDDAEYYAKHYGATSDEDVNFGGAWYTVYVSYDEETGTYRHDVYFYNEPSCTTVFNVSLSNGSKHTYVYKEGSLTVASPDVSNEDHTGIEGFDGQELPNRYTTGSIIPKYDLKNPDTEGVIEEIVDKALENLHSNTQYGVDEDGNLVIVTTKRDMSGFPVEKIGKYYYIYSESAGCYYGRFTKAQVKEDKENPGHYYSTYTTGKDPYAYIKTGDDTVEPYYVPYVRGNSVTTTKVVNDKLNAYFKANNTSLEKEILKHYSEQDGITYTTFDELLANNPDAEKELTGNGNADATTALNAIKIHSSKRYDNFYQNILSFNVGDEDEMDKFLSDDHLAHGHLHGDWAEEGKQLTIGDYMVDKLDETPGAWDKANNYFNALLASGMTEDEATWAAFTMAVNIDGKLTGNDYQDTAWNWYASMVLHQADGTLDLTKKDADTGEVIGDDEGEGQTSFYLWKYETDKDGNENPMYCTYVEPTYTTNEDGEQVLEKDGFYCWVKYDPTKDKLTYTVTTTNGKLNIDYALLENVVYYLQEAIAPEGYDIDPEIYVICSQEDYDKLEGTEVTNPATGATSKVTESNWLGSIIGGKTLPINFMNTATVPDPDPDPTPDPDPVPPTDPDTPVDPENPDTPPVQDETPSDETPSDETPVTPENPQNPAVQDATPDAATLPKTGTTGWMAAALASLGSLLMACGWFFTRKQYSPKH